MATLVDDFYAELCSIPILDPHSHIEPNAPSAKNYNDLLGYHYYTELAHSAGLAKDKIEGATGLEKPRNIVGHLRFCRNTVQYSWLVELSKTFFGLEADEVNENTIDGLYAAAEQRCAAPDWTEQVIKRTNLEAIFLTNDFDDPLVGFDVDRYVPCLRTDDLVFKLAEPAVRARLVKATGNAVENFASIVSSMGKLFERFAAKSARACAISLPPDFEPIRPSRQAAETAFEKILLDKANEEDRRDLAHGVFYALADYCEDFKLPFDLMIGVNRRVYPGGVHQGQDLFDRRTSLIQYRRLFNEKSKVTFPISVLTHGQNQELVSYSWIFPNVVTSGHWWYSNIPAFIEPDLRGRLEAAPANKQIGYYSDAYKLEFVLPKYNTYRRCLAKVLAENFVGDRGWSTSRAIELARQLLRDNIERIFPKH